MQLQPSSAAVKAAQSAAASRHALINLTRLVHSLAEKGTSGDVEDDAVVGTENGQWILVRKDWETVLYARALLDAIRGSNEQSSTSGVTLNGLSQTLDKIEKGYKDALENTPSPTSRPTSPNTAIATTEPQKSFVKPIPIVPVLPRPPSLRQRHTSTLSVTPSSTRDYLAARREEDEKGGESGLLPLKNVITTSRGNEQAKEPGARDRLLGGSRGVGNAVGAAQLHDELGGQLAEMSHRLKLNALHFASSLDEEKTLLETSQGVLEKNLGATRSSKAQLSTVSKKSRGTTCMTLGVVVLVMILWMWMYMLIRFT